jgi:hypothetical protein
VSFEIQAFQGDQRIARRLWRFDCDLYDSRCNWIPPFRKSYLRHFSATGPPRYQDPRDDHRHFLARRNGDVVGHVSAFLNHQLRNQDEPVGAIGYFECVEDQEVACELLGRAVAWLKAEHQIDRIWAPFNFDIWHGYRLMTRGFALAPFLGEPQNPHYYPALLEGSGFAVHKRWHSVELSDRQSIQNLRDSSWQRYEEVESKGYRFRTINPRSPEQLRVLYELVVDSFHRFPGYTKPPPDVFQELVTAALRMTNPHFSCLAYDPSDVPCGFCVAFPDQSEAVRSMRGRSGIRSRLRFWRKRHRHGGRVIFYLIGISSREFGKRHGLGRAVFCKTLDRFLQSHFTRLMLAIMAEDSPARSLAGRTIDAASREYALYEM